MPKLVVTWYTEMQSNTVFISNPFPLCLIYCYIFKCTNSYTSFIHKTTGTVLYLSKFQQPVVRDSWIDVLCCHLVFFLRLDLFISLWNEGDKGSSRCLNSWKQLLICIIKQMHLWHLGRIPWNKQLNPVFNNKQQLTSLLLTGKALAFYPEGTWWKSKLTGQQNVLWASGYSPHLAKILLGCLSLQEWTVWFQSFAYYFSLGKRYKGSQTAFCKKIQFKFKKIIIFKWSKITAIFFSVAKVMLLNFLGLQLTICITS